MEKEISDGIKKIKDPKEQLLVRLLLGAIIFIVPLLIMAMQAQISDRDKTIGLLRNKLGVSDSLYNDCGKQLLRTAVNTIDKLEKNQKANDSIRNLIIKIK